MARARSPAEILLVDVIARAVTPPLKASGFRKAGMNYHRRHGETAQVVNVQVGHGSNWAEKTFYINAGIAFDALCRLSRVPVLERPREYECDGRGTRDRLRELVPDAPDSWMLRAGDEVEATVGSIRGTIGRLVAELDRIDGPAAYRSHPWFDRFRPRAENAQVLYLLNDPDGAWREVEGLSALFADRKYPCLADGWVERLRLTGLESRLAERRT